MSIAQVTVQKSAPWLRQQPTNIPGYRQTKTYIFFLCQGADFCALTSAKSKFGKAYYIEDRDVPQITFEIVQFGFRWLKVLEIGLEGIPKLQCLCKETTKCQDWTLAVSKRIWSKLCTVCSWNENQECTTLWHSCGISIRSIGNQADIHEIQHGMDNETEAATWRVVLEHLQGRATVATTKL